MLLETEVKFTMPENMLAQVKVAKGIRGWGTWLVTDPRVQAIFGHEKQRRNAHNRINRQIPDAPEQYCGPEEPMAEPPWERPRTPYVAALLESWFEHKKTIPITRLIRPLGQSLGWRTDAIMNVDGSVLADWVAMQEGFTFHRTEEGWYAKTNYGNPEVRLIFPWVAAENDAVDAAEMASLDRRAKERRARRKERGEEDRPSRTPKVSKGQYMGVVTLSEIIKLRVENRQKPLKTWEEFKSIYPNGICDVEEHMMQAPLQPVVPVVVSAPAPAPYLPQTAPVSAHVPVGANPEILKDYKERLEILESQNRPPISWEEFQKEWHEIAASEAVVVPPEAPPAKPAFDEAARREFFFKAFPPPPGYTPSND